MKKQDELLQTLAKTCKEMEQVLELPDGSGNRTVEDQQKYGVIPDNCEEVVDRSLDNFENKIEGFTIPDFDAQRVQQNIARARALRPFLEELQTWVRCLSQAERILEGEAWAEMRSLYDHIKVLSKKHPGLAARFEELYDALKKPARARKAKAASPKTPATNSKTPTSTEEKKEHHPVTITKDR